MPWRQLCTLIEPVYPKLGKDRSPVSLERMLRIYFLQQWFNLSDLETAEVLYDSLAMRRSAGIDLGREPVPGATVLPDLLHGDETGVWGDQAYRGQRDVIREAALNATDFTNRRYRHRVW